VDYVIRGEGETPFFGLIQRLTSGRGSSVQRIEGVCSRGERRLSLSSLHIENNVDLVPDRSLLAAPAYRINKKPYTFLLTSRGCPFHCAFCGKPPVPYRRKSLATVEREISDCLRLGLEAIDFEDDMLTLDMVHFNHILDLFKGTGLTLSAMNGIYTVGLDGSTLENMAAAGFRRLNFSLVDASTLVTDKQKRFPAEAFLRLLPILDTSPFLVETHFIIGLPEQSHREIFDTIILLMDRRLLLGPSIFYLTPNSASPNQTDAADWEYAIKAMRSSALVSVNPNLPRRALYTIMKLVRFVNFVKHLLDRESGLGKLSDILALPDLNGNPLDHEIFTTLLLEKRLVHFDLGQKEFVEEHHDSALVKLFFERIKGRSIRGFKTMHSLIVD
jgi:hypothetical protein